MSDILLGDLRDIWRDNKDAAEAIETILNNEDFAQENTLSSIDEKVATQTTLAELKDRLNTAGANEIGLLIESLEDKVATQSELEAVKSELETIKANQTNGDQKVQQTGRIVERTVETTFTIPEDSSYSIVREMPEEVKEFYFSFYDNLGNVGSDVSVSIRFGKDSEDPVNRPADRLGTRPTYDEGVTGFLGNKLVEIFEGRYSFAGTIPNYGPYYEFIIKNNNIENEMDIRNLLFVEKIPKGEKLWLKENV